MYISILRGIDNLDSDVSSTADEFSYMDNLSESSSSNNSEDQMETDQLIGWPCKIVGLQNYVSALSFSKSTAVNSSVHNSCQLEKPHSDSHDFCDEKDATDHLVKSSCNIMTSSHMSKFLNPGKPNCSFKVSTQYGGSLIDGPVGDTVKNSFGNDEIHGQNEIEKQLKLLRGASFYHGDTIISDGESLVENLYDNNRHSLNLYRLLPQNIDHQYNSPCTNPLSMNPMLTRNALLCMMGRNGEKYITDHRKPLPSFNFSTVEDPFKVHMDKLLINSRCSSESAFSLDCRASANGNKNDHHCEEGHGGEDDLIDNTQNCVIDSLDLKDRNQDVLRNASGGSSWERLLGSFRKTINCDDATHKKIFLSTSEIPLDIIIDKCLLQEIILQYP